jgi:hypothetical protein
MIGELGKCFRGFNNPVTQSLLLTASILLVTLLGRSETGMQPDPSQKKVETAASAKQIRWTLEGPYTPWNIAHSRFTELVVVRSDTDIGSVVLSRAALVDSSQGKGWPLPQNHIHLCPAGFQDPKGCKNKVTLTDRKTTVYLAVDEDFTDDGSYAGTIELDTEPFTETKSVPLTIQQSREQSRGIGLLLLIVGVTTAWAVLAFGRARLSRNQALLPALLLRDRLSETMRQLQSLPKDLLDHANTTLNSVSSLIGKLNPSNLDVQQFLPPELPSIGGSQPVQLSGYQAFLQTSSQTADLLNVLVVEGLLPAGKLWSQQMPPASLVSLEQFVSNLDALSAGFPQALPPLRAAIKALYDQWNNQPRAQVEGLGISPLVMPAPQTPTVMSVFVRIELFTALFWLVWAILAVVVGGLVLIFPNPSFGGIMDYSRCFLWGFGLPVAGQSIQQLTMSSVNSGFGVSISR